MVFQNRCHLVFWTRIASSLEGLKLWPPRSTVSSGAERRYCYSSQSRQPEAQEGRLCAYWALGYNCPRCFTYYYSMLLLCSTLLVPLTLWLLEALKLDQFKIMWKAEKWLKPWQMQSRLGWIRWLPWILQLPQISAGSQNMYWFLYTAP